MPTPLLLIIGSAIIFAPLCSWLAAQRGRSWAAWFFFGALLGPIAAVILLLAPPGRCPVCGAAVRGWPRRCQACGAGFDEAQTAAAKRAGKAPPPAPVAPGEAMTGVLGTGLFVGGSGLLQVGSRYLLERVGNELHVLGPIEVAPSDLKIRLPLPLATVTLVGDRLFLGDQRGSRERGLAFTGVALQPGLDLEAALLDPTIGLVIADGASLDAIPEAATMPVAYGKPGPVGRRDLLSPVVIASVLAVAVGAAVAYIGLGAGGAGAGVATPSPSATATASPQPAMDPETRGALLAVQAIGKRLLIHQAALEAVVDPVDADEIAVVIRAMSPDLLAGRAAAERLIDDPATVELGGDLLGLYDAIIERNDETVRASIQNTRAWGDGGRDVLELLAAVPALNQRIFDALLGRGLATPTPSPVTSAGPSASAAPSAAPSPSPSPTPAPTATVAPTATPEPSETPEPTQTPTPSPGVGLLPNPGFEDGLDGWLLIVAPGAAAEVALDPDARTGEAAARIDIATGSPARAGISLTAGDVPMSGGRFYTVEVSVRASEAREVRIRLVDGRGQTVTARVENVGTEWTDISFTTAALFSDPAMRIALDVGRSEATVWFDDVNIREATSAPQPGG